MAQNEQRQEPLLVEALFDSSLPPLELDHLRAGLAQRFGNVESVAPDNTSGAVAMFALHDLASGIIEGKDVPSTISFISVPELAPSEPLAASAAQTWDWPDASAAVAVATSAWVVMPMLSWAWLDRRTRLELLHAGLEAVLVHEPVALHWPQCERLVSPVTYLQVRSDPADPLYPAVNVRMFRITDGRPGEILMDTLGLAPLGLPDFQIRFVGLEPTKVAHQLSSLALYVFEHGDVIAEGHTVEGVPAGSAWRCSRSAAALPPARPVVKLATQN